MVKTIFVASTNKGKILEIEELVRNSKLNIAIEKLEYNLVKEPGEPYDTFLENANHKAFYYSEYTKHPTICDDSGLCIEALNGFPGVKTKDFLEKCGSFSNAFIELEKLLANHRNTKAYFQTAVSIYFPETKSFICCESQSYGCIAFPAKGGEGFGFDPVFIPEGFNKSLAELGLDVKNQISHRSKAIKKLLIEVEKLFL